ncbi:MAG: DNA polymerase/3'-5' exonuclease PolX [Acidimicrobiia bacterium]
MVSNSEVASHLYELARLTTLAEGSSNAFRVRAYETAARAVEGHPEPVGAMSATDLTGLRGVGKSTAAKIRSLVDDGRIERLEELRAQFPPEFVEMTRVPGVGPKTAVLLRDELGVASVDALRSAISREELRELPGMGEKTEENIARSLERLGETGKERRTPINDAMRVGREITAALAGVPGVVKVAPMGSLRRFRETIGDVDVIVASSGDADAVMKALIDLPLVRDVVGSGPRKTSVVTAAGLQIDVRVVRPHQYGAAQMYFTGSKAHNIRLRQMAIDRGWILNEYALTEAESDRIIASETEEEVYAAFGLPWIPPEMREDTGEIEAALAGELPDFVSEEDLLGDLHVHTSLSGDGREDLDSMVESAKKRGYTYLAITDHAEDLAINGASRDEMLEQRSRISEIRKRNRKMRVLHGAELNIGRDGSIDYDPDFLAGFDWGVASVHSYFDLPVAEQTERVIAAMRNPGVNVIGHLTGRYLGKRPGIELDVDAVLNAAEETGCGIEINCHLHRLDAPSQILRRARDRDVVFVISTDSHDAAELGNVRWGVRQARRGWVDRERVANTWERDRFLEWADRKRSR